MTEVWREVDENKVADYVYTSEAFQRCRGALDSGSNPLLGRRVKIEESSRLDARLRYC
jgi:hypothetical protein